MPKEEDLARVRARNALKGASPRPSVRTGSLVSVLTCAQLYHTVLLDVDTNVGMSTSLAQSSKKA